MTHEWRRGEYLISTDRTRLNIETIHGFLSRSYWAAGIPVEVVRHSIEHSLTFGVYYEMAQVGFARVITDYATFAYLADVFILEPFRGQGLAQWLIATIVSHPELHGLRRWLLATEDAHDLYRRSGFTELAHPERFMERHFPDVYRQPPIV